MCKFIYWLFFLFLISYGEGAKILGVFYVPGPSQYLAGNTMMKILAEKGHDVTIVAPFKEKNPPPNYKQIVLDGLYDKWVAMTANIFDLSVTPTLFSYLALELIENALNHTEFQKLMNSNEKFDVVIIEEFQCESLKYIAKHFKASLIMYCSMDTNEWINPYQGNPEHPAYVPNFFLRHLSSNMTFFERVENVLYYVFANVWRGLMVVRMQNDLLHKYYPNAPDLNDIIYDVDLVLLNANLAVHEPLPKVPSLVDIGGFHIVQPKKLPEDLQQLLDNSKNGVIYFSLGSNLKIENMPKDKQEIFMKAFSRISETVIMKSDVENLPGKPDNVILRKWLPQNDILAHKNIKLFISHGGLFGTMEGVYHEVPMLIIPVFAEQHLNAKRAEMYGYAKSVHYKELTKEIFNEYLKELLENPAYKENAVRRSKIMKDKPIPPAEALNYWVEYVVRHKGGSHLRVAGLNLSWYEYYLIDVIAFLSLSLIALVYISKLLYKCIFKRKSKKVKQN